MAAVTYGCDCTDHCLVHTLGGHPSDTAPVAFEKGGKRYCTRCLTFEDLGEGGRLLVDDETVMGPFMNYDPLGCVVLVTREVKA